MPAALPGTRPLHVVSAWPAPSTLLLEALAQWTAGSASCSRIGATLQLSDGELTGDFLLTEAQVTALTNAINQLAQAPGDGGR